MGTNGNFSNLVVSEPGVLNTDALHPSTEVGPQMSDACSGIANACPDGAEQRELACSEPSLQQLPVEPVVNFTELRVAVVDDEPPNQRVAMRFLRLLSVPAGNITILHDGASAIDVLRDAAPPADTSGGSSSDMSVAGRSQEQSRSSRSSVVGGLDVMLLDIRMPGKTGIDVMQEFGRACGIPVIAMTGNVDTDSVALYRCVCCALWISTLVAVAGCHEVVDTGLPCVQRCRVRWCPCQAVLQAVLAGRNQADAAQAVVPHRGLSLTFAWFVSLLWGGSASLHPILSLLTSSGVECCSSHEPSVARFVWYLSCTCAHPANMEASTCKNAALFT